MFDLSHIPTNAHVTTYSSRLTSAITKWQAWTRPAGAQFVYILAIGGGGGGGGGRSAAVGTGKGGGGGGGSGAVTNSLYLAATIPDRLFVQVGDASTGAGGAAGSDGTQGPATYVGVYPSTAAQNLLSYTQGGTKGSGSTGTGGGGGGGGGSIASGSVACLLNKAIFFASSAGVAGSAGGGTSAPSNIAVGTTIPILGGCGGGSYQAGGSTYDGAGYAFDGYIPNLAGGAKDGVTAGAGNHGLWLPPYHFGGTGGGGTNDGSSTGGRGGDGAAPGAGGGGGGAGVTGGRGGDGGPAFVLIAAW